MKIGKVDFNTNLAKLSLKDFKKHCKKFEGKVKESPEEIYELLGGKLPKKKVKKDSE